MKEFKAEVEITYDDGTILTRVMSGSDREETTVDAMEFVRDMQTIASTTAHAYKTKKTLIKFKVALSPRGAPI